MAKSIRFHHKDGQIVVWTWKVLAIQNDTDVKGAKALVKEWEEKGYIVRRKDGGYDIEKFIPSKQQEKSK